MTSTEIWKILNRITPKKPVYGLACSMASLDTKTVLDLIDKYQRDLELSQDEIQHEISKQKIRKLTNEQKTIMDINFNMPNVNN